MVIKIILLYFIGLPLVILGTLLIARAIISVVVDSTVFYKARRNNRIGVCELCAGEDILYHTYSRRYDINRFVCHKCIKDMRSDDWWAFNDKPWYMPDPSDTDLIDDDDDIIDMPGLGRWRTKDDIN